MKKRFRLNRDLAIRLKKFAEIEGVSVKDVVLTAIDAYLNPRQNRLTPTIERIKNEDSKILNRLQE